MSSSFKKQIKEIIFFLIGPAVFLIIVFRLLGVHISLLEGIFLFPTVAAGAYIQAPHNVPLTRQEIVLRRVLFGVAWIGILGLVAFVFTS